MNSFVGRLLEFEERARRMTDEARAHYEQTIRQVSREQEQLRESYRQRAEEHIADAGQASQAEVEQRIARLEAQYRDRERALETAWQSGRERWRTGLADLCKKGG